VKVQLHPEAEEELFEGAAWYEDREPGLGDQFFDEVARWFDVVAEAPATWPRWPDSPVLSPPIRRVVLDRFPYSIGYQAFPDRIWIVVVAHASRAPFYWIRRA
jgi:hypothetical protein